MTMLYRAPTDEQNIVGPRDFAYVAEVDILGWKFRKMTNGTLQIETPRPSEEEGGLFAQLNPTHVDLLASLIDSVPIGRGDDVVGENKGVLA